MIPRYRVLRERIEAELIDVRGAVGKAREAYDAADAAAFGFNEAWFDKTLSNCGDVPLVGY